MRFTFSMQDKMHQEVKIRAAMRNVTMSRWVAQAISARLASERKYEEKAKKQEDDNVFI